MNELLIMGYSNITSEGIVLHLNMQGTLKSGNVATKEFWVSWDKIGKALFDDYCNIQDVSELRKLRKEYSKQIKNKK